jgi:hypothetical protein
MKKLLRLLVACSIRNCDSYYQTSLASKGIDYTKLTHPQIAAWKATIKIIEADLLIDTAFDLKGKSHLKDVDLSFIPDK